MHCVVFKNSHNGTLSRNIYSCKTQRDDLLEDLPRTSAKVNDCLFVNAKRMYVSITKRLDSDLDAAFYLVLTFLFIPHGQTFPPFKGAGDYEARYLQTKWLVRFVLAVILITA